MGFKKRPKLSKLILLMSIRPNEHVQTIRGFVNFKLLLFQKNSNDSQTFLIDNKTYENNKIGKKVDFYQASQFKSLLSKFAKRFQTKVLLWFLKQVILC